MDLDRVIRGTDWIELTNWQLVNTLVDCGSVTNYLARRNHYIIICTSQSRRSSRNRYPLTFVCKTISSFFVLCAVRFCELRPRAASCEDLWQRDVGGDKVGKRWARATRGSRRADSFISFHPLYRAASLCCYLPYCMNRLMPPPSLAFHSSHDRKLRLMLTFVRFPCTTMWFFMCHALHKRSWSRDYASPRPRGALPRLALFSCSVSLYIAKFDASVTRIPALL